MEEEYLLELRDAHRYGTKTSKASPVSVGDVVLIHDDNKPRGFWRLGCVKNLINGSDGHIRGAILTATSPGERRITLQRPLQHLYPLEVKAIACNTESEPDDVSEFPGVKSTINTPKRAAAIKARDQCKAVALYKQELDSY